MATVGVKVLSSDLPLAAEFYTMVVDVDYYQSGGGGVRRHSLLNFITLVQPSVSSSLQITNRSFR